MRWYHYVSYFFGGFFLANCVPHLASGMLGNAFQSPFASPPGVGLSSSVVNVVWGFANLAVGYLLTGRVGTFTLRNNRHLLLAALGFFASSLTLAIHMGGLHGGLAPAAG